MGEEFHVWGRENVGGMMKCIVSNRHAMVEHDSTNKVDSFIWCYIAKDEEVSMILILLPSEQSAI